MVENARWNNSISFILTMIGASVGLGNIWRFSYVLYSNGGGSFFIPYLIAIAILGIPFLILEYGIGYTFKDSFTNIFKKINPKFEFLSWIVIFIIFAVGIYYVVIIGWDLAYLFSSFTFAWGNDPGSYFTNHIGGNSDLSNPISFLIPTTLCIMVVWFLTWFISHKNLNDGIATFSKIAIPLLFVIMFGINIYAFTLPGANLGVETLIRPDWNMLLNIRVWIAAFSQILFSLSIGQGIVITLSSYLPEGSKLTDNVFVVVISNCLFETFTAFGVFSILGYMSFTSQVPITQLISEGTGLVFVVFPQIFNVMGDVGCILAPIFFTVIFFAGMTSIIGMMEPVINSILHKFKLTRKKSVTIVCATACMFSLIFSINIGSYLIGIIDGFANNFLVLLFVAVQCIIFSWIFDIKSLIPALNKNSRIKVGTTWVAIIKYILPIIIVIMWLIGIYDIIINAELINKIVYLIVSIAILVASAILYKIKR